MDSYSDGFEGLEEIQAELATEGTVADVAGLKAMALELLTEAELEEQLGFWDEDPPALFAFYQRLAERILRASPELEWDEAVKAYISKVWERDYPYDGTVEGSPRHLWAMILDVPLHEVTGGEPQPPAVPHPPYRLVPDEEPVSDEAARRGLDLLMKLTRRRLRPIDPNPTGPGEPWQWPDRTCQISLAVRGAVRDALAAGVCDGPYRGWVEHRFAALLDTETAAPF